MKQIKNKWTFSRRDFVLRYVFMLVACLCYALSLDLFIVPNKIVGGGVTGLSTLISYTTDWNIGTLSIILNIPILLGGLYVEGKVFLLNCLLTTSLLGIFTDMFAFLPPLTTDPLLASLYGGLTSGIGVGLFVRYMVSSGGTELLARILHKKWESISISKFIAILDACIVVAGSIVMKNPENVLYALIIIAGSTFVSNTVVVGLNSAKLCHIITEKPEEMAALLVQNSPRGVTLLDAKGAYTGSKRGVLITCVKSNQITQLRAMVRQIDPESFVIVSNANEVRGKGFLDI